MKRISMSVLALAFLSLLSLAQIGLVTQSYAVSCVAPPAGMVSWWGGDNTTLDMVGGHNAVLMGNATYAPGMVGEAYSLDGAEATFVEIPNTADFNPSGAFSMDGWFYIDPSVNAGKIATLFAKTEGSTGNGWALYFDDRTGVGASKSLKFTLGSILEVANAVPTTGWYHIAAVFDPLTSPQATLYVNGAVVGSRVSSGATTNSLNVRIGAMYWTDQYHQGNDRLNGMADEIEFFSRALSSNEIAAIYNAGSAGKCRSCATPPSGMIAWWGGDNNALDMVGSNDGTLNGVATFAEGIVGQSFSFDGSSAYVSVPYSPSLDFTGGDFSVDAWVNPTTVDTYGEGITGSLASDNLSGWGFAIQGTWYGTAGKLNFFGNGDWVGQSDGVVATNTWTHVAVTRSGNSLTYYINGVPSGSFTNASSTGSLDSGLPLMIGDMYPLWAGSVWRFSGGVDEVEFFNRALSAQEIADIARSTNKGKCRSCTPPPSGMIAWWGGDNNALDIVGMSNGTLQNGTIYADGKVGQAFSLDGVDDYISGNASLLPLGNSARTITAWIKTDRVADQSILHYGIQNGTLPPKNFHMILANATGIAIAGIGNGWGYGGAFGTSNVSDGQWHFIAGLYEGAGTNMARIFVDGVEQGNAVITEPGTGDGSFEIGRFLDDIAGPGAEKFQGLIDEVAVFTRALSAEEIAAVYNASSAGMCRSCTAPPSGMVAWWQGESDATDIVGGNSGTLVNGTAFVPGRVGQAFSFNGVDNYVAIPDSPSLDIATVISVDAWIYRKDAAHAGLLNKGALGTNGVYDLAIYSDKFYFRLNGADLNMPSTTSIPINEWTHVAGTYDGATAKIYINGLLDASQAYSGSIATDNNPLYIGLYGAPAVFFNGLIDELELFNRALSADEIAAIYNAGSAGKCAYPIGTNSPSNGTIECNSFAASGYPASCTITPSQGYYLSALTDNSVDVLGSVSGATYTISSVNEAHTVEATFSEYLVRIYPTRTDGYDNTIQAVYDKALTGEEIQAQTTSVNGALDLNQPIAVTIRGGYGAGFTGPSGFSDIGGTVTVTDGTVTFADIVIQ